MIFAEIMHLGADKPGVDLLQAVAGYGRELKKAAAEFEQPGQTEAAANLRKEIAVVEEFLPKQMDDVALAELVRQVLAGMGAVGGMVDGDRMRAGLAAKLGGG